jgi:hypothetical protein
MLFVYAGLNLRLCDQRAREALPTEGTIDMSRLAVGALADALATVCQHRRSETTTVYMGFVDPILMLTPPDEARCRRAFRTLNVYLVVSNPFILPFSWKNGLGGLVVVEEHRDAQDTQTLNDGCAAHLSGSQD